MTLVIKGIRIGDANDMLCVLFNVYYVYLFSRLCKCKQIVNHSKYL
jgi:hypothetical protein